MPEKKNQIVKSGCALLSAQQKTKLPDPPSHAMVELASMSLETLALGKAPAEDTSKLELKVYVLIVARACRRRTRTERAG